MMDDSANEGGHKAPEPTDSGQPPSTLLEIFLSPHKIPGPIGILIGVIFGIANWRGAIELMVPGVKVLGGWAEIMIDLLSSPIIPVLLVFWGGFYLWWSGSRDEWHPNDRAAVQLIGWLVPLVFVLPLCAVALFGTFITTSHITELSEYVMRQTYQRHLNAGRVSKSHDDLRRISSSVPQTIQVVSVPSREPVQFAYEIIKTLRDAGFHIAGAPAQSGGANIHYPDMPEIIQLPDARLVRIEIIANDNYEGRSAGNALADALKLIDVRAHVNVRSQPTDELILLIGDAS